MARGLMMPAGKFERLTVLQCCVLLCRRKYNARYEDIAVVLGCSHRNVTYVVARCQAKGYRTVTSTPESYTLRDLELFVENFFDKYGVIC